MYSKSSFGQIYSFSRLTNTCILISVKIMWCKMFIYQIFIPLTMTCKIAYSKIKQSALTKFKFVMQWELTKEKKTINGQISSFTKWRLIYPLDILKCISIVSFNKHYLLIWTIWPSSTRLSFMDFSASCLHKLSPIMFKSTMPLRSSAGPSVKLKNSSAAANPGDVLSKALTVYRQQESIPGPGVADIRVAHYQARHNDLLLL